MRERQVCCQGQTGLQGNTAFNNQGLEHVVTNTSDSDNDEGNGVFKSFGMKKGGKRQKKRWGRNGSKDRRWAGKQTKFVVIEGRDKKNLDDNLKASLV